jgi:hypothetical protein
MNKHQRLQREHDAGAREKLSENSLSSVYLNCAPGFRGAYGMRPGGPRRQALLALFRRHPTARLPVNNRWQANTVDPDLQHLLKKGLLVRERGGGGHQHPRNRSSSKRQTYLVAAMAH